MKITLTGKQVDIGDRLRKHVEENIENSVNLIPPKLLILKKKFPSDLF